jgi:hypothetical protein
MMVEKVRENTIWAMANFISVDVSLRNKSLSKLNLCSILRDSIYNLNQITLDNIDIIVFLLENLIHDISPQ